ncbi:hypothetical protein F2P81_013955 [Scophthalmus maximus]|uniref:RILP-like protein 1 n=1 Tax=Scophthalmus maximus TaxID=52904 RepID=A0A6A4SMN3_SCOMX|nr:hypothetical protein F2P81_013955 [Scophthalmus maximus]
METRETSALDRPAAELTVMDVYDAAAVLAHEFERVIDRFGCESLVGVVPKVVRVLELLEALELELVDDVWRGEVQDLLSQITRLQAENKRLLVSISPKESPVTQEDLQKQEGMSEKERQVMKKLGDLVDKQRDEIRAKDHDLTLKNEDVEALQMQQHRLIRINQDLRHRIGVMEAQGKGLIRQRAEMEAAAQARQQEKVPADTEPEEEVDSLEQESDKPRFTLQELRDVLQERNELKAQVFLLQEELAYYKSDDSDDDTSSIVCTSPPPSCSNSTDPPESGIRRL